MTSGTTPQQTLTRTSAVREATPRQLRWRSRKARETIAAYVFLTPWILGMVLLTLGPMLYSLYLSFTRYNLLSDPKWVGFANFVQMFTADSRFLKSVGVTLVYVLVSVPLLLVVSMLVALLLNTSVKFVTAYRVLFYLRSLMATIGAFQAFTGAYVVSGGTGGPVESTLFYTLYLYQQGFAQLNMGYAAAMAWLLVIVLAAVTGVFFWTARFWVHYGDE